MMEQRLLKKKQSKQYSDMIVRTLALRSYSYNETYGFHRGHKHLKKAVVVNEQIKMNSERQFCGTLD